MVEQGQSESSGVRRWPGSHVLRLDVRSLALVRITTGVILFLDTMVRWGDRKAHYTDFGLLPRGSLLEMGWNQNWFSLHMATNSSAWLALLFALQAGLAVALIVGWRTQVTTLASWLLLISIHARNPMVLNGGDVYLRVMLFWMLFLPWGWAWSWDARRRREQEQGSQPNWVGPISQDGKTVFGAAPLALLLQVSFVYWFAALPKYHPSWTVDYSATQLVLQLDLFLTPFGIFFRENFAPYLALLTFLVIMWEFWGPFFFFFPFDRGQVRTLGVFGISFMHLGFLSCLQLGFFGWIGATMVLALLPSWFWDGPAARVSKVLDARLFRPVAGSARHSGSKGLVWGIRDSLALLLIAYVFLWNCSNEGVTPSQLRLTQEKTWLGHTLRLDQRWNMFSPGPFTDDGWYVIEAQRRDGSVIDLFREGKPVDRSKPKLVSKTFPNERWRKYMTNIWLQENQRYRLPFGQYLCRRWNSQGRGAQEVFEFKIIYFLERTNLDGTEAPVEERVIWHHWCFEEPTKSPEQQVEESAESPEVDEQSGEQELTDAVSDS